MNRTYLMAEVFIILLLGSLTNSSCAAVNYGMPLPPPGGVYPVQIGTTLQGMQAARNGLPGTAMLAKDNLVAFIWNVRNGWMFSVINTSTETPLTDFLDASGKGNLVSARDMSDLVNCLKANGWKVIGAAELPDTVKIGLASAGAWAAIARGVVSFLVVPVLPGQFQDLPGQEWKQ
jgi:hypothetical protein